MTSLLHVDSSPSDASVSRRLTALFARVWCDLHGPAGYVRRDVVAEPAPLVGPAYVALGTRLESHGVIARADVPAYVAGPEEEREWALTRPLVEEVLDADTILLGVPMHNFSVPAGLKAWIDRITFPGMYVDPATGDSLLRGTRVVAVLARGGGYGPGTPRAAYDFQEPYLRGYFGNLGVVEEDLYVVRAEYTRTGDIPALARFADLTESSYVAAEEDVRRLAAQPVARAVTPAS